MSNTDECQTWTSEVFNLKPQNLYNNVFWHNNIEIYEFVKQKIGLAVLYFCITKPVNFKERLAWNSLWCRRVIYVDSFWPQANKILSSGSFKVLDTRMWVFLYFPHSETFTADIHTVLFFLNEPRLQRMCKNLKISQRLHLSTRHTSVSKNII